MKNIFIFLVISFCIGCTNQAKSTSSEAQEEYAISAGATICWQPRTVKDGDTVCQNTEAEPQLSICKAEEEKAGHDTDQKSLDTSKSFEKCMLNAGWFKAMQTIKF